MGRIAILDRNMINMIAAGEVIERPASVVKELIENSIDSGATRILVEVEDGGRKLISVTDDGCGMEADDLALAFEPHATSKVHSSVDLNTIRTMGFRGEALASISAIAQVKGVSRCRENAEAYAIEIDCGEKKDVAPCSGDYGTSIQVRDIFYKLPARRKFLKTAQTEMGHISECFVRIALSRCDLNLELKHNGRKVYRVNSGQSYLDRISELFPKDIAESLVQTVCEERGMKITALLGNPASARSSANYQYVFLNSRFIRDKFISHAIREAYRGSIDPNRYPVVFLFIEMPTEDFDVNVHPTKTEVRFFNSNLVHSQVLGCLREKLLGTKFSTSGHIPKTGDETSKESVRQAMEDFLSKHRPGTSGQKNLNFGGAFRSGTIRNYPEPQEFKRERGQDDYVTSTENACDTNFKSLDIPVHKFMQVHDSYIVMQTDNGFVVVDQHALHERVIYQELKQRVSSGSLESQKLLIPESFDVNEIENAALAAHKELLKTLGIELTDFGPKSLAVQSFPSLLGKVSPADFMRDMVDLFTEKQVAPDADSLLDSVLHMAACKAAVKAGHRLAAGEIEHLLEQMETTDRSGNCPHGRPTSIFFSLSELEKQFKRT